jgi:Tol biopolymer transport system component
MCALRQLSLLFVVALLATSCGAEPSTQQPLRNGRIAFIRDRNLFTADSNGKDVRQLTHLAAVDQNVDDPDWSPDGHRIAVGTMAAPTHEYDDIAIIPETGGEPPPPGNLGDERPTWSPDGRKIAYDVLSDGAYLTIWNLQTHRSEPVAPGSNPDAERFLEEYEPDWSPDGKWIAFTRRSDGGPPRLYVVHPDGAGRAPIGTIRGQEPNWSPEGDRLVFVRSGHLAIVNRDGSGLISLGSGRRRETDPVWSPDGKKIAFAREQQRCRNSATRCPTSVWVLEVESRREHLLIQNAGGPSWQPLVTSSE